MKIQLGKWGRSLALRFPKHLVERFNLKEGDAIDDSVLERALELSREDRRQEALRQIAAAKWKLPDDYKFDRDEANAR